MIAIAGPILIIGAAVLLWYMLPKQGRPHRWATAPVLQSLIPTVIVGMFATGLVLTIFSM
ncbi:hypothetical protein LMTR3_06545 [Bradyrhizobium sp. LMTR 3]|nr:hypothetical protein LMTR3_06545 [Bradyrhizobium sp. LMTR 3]